MTKGFPENLFEFLDRADKANLRYLIEYNRERAISVYIAVPTGRWEFDFHSDGEIDVEIFTSNGVEEGEEDKKIEDFFLKYSD